ncbi:MAG: hypothetical protein ABJ308_09760 [Halieaceae bacterium]
MKKDDLKDAIIASGDELMSVLDDELGVMARDLLLVPKGRSPGSELPFTWSTARGYYDDYCSGGNDCPDSEFPADCTHFVSHGLDKTDVVLNSPEADCQRNLCIRVAELAAAFQSATVK